jgi:hypothetical protein
MIVTIRLPVGVKDCMEKDKNSEKSPAPGSREPWEPPSIEQLDFAAAEAQYGVPGGPEFGLYAS